MAKEGKLHKVIPVFKTLFPIIGKKYPAFFVIKTLDMIFSTLHPFIGIFITPLLIDELITTRNIKQIITYVLALVIGETLITIITSLCHNKIMKYKERVNNYLDWILSKHIMELDFQLTEDKKALDQLEKARNGLSWYGSITETIDNFYAIISNILKSIGLVTIIAINAPLILILIFVGVVIATILMEKQNKVQFYYYEKLSKVNRMFGYFGWTVSDFRYGKDIRLYNAKDMMVDRWKKFSDESTKHWEAQAQGCYPYSLTHNMIDIIRTMLTFFYVGYLAINGSITIGGFTQLVEASGQLNGSFGGIIWTLQSIVQKCAYSFEFVNFMHYPEAIPKGTLPVENKNHIIEFKDVCFAYPGTDKMILNGINIKINPGEKLSIVGLNGAGKTTFIKLLCRLYDPTSGEILLDGVNIKNYDYKQYMKQFAPVFQDFRIFGFKINENIIFKDESKMSEEEKAAFKNIIELVELDKMIEKQKNGAETFIFRYFDDNGIEPSGGEQQKMAIARALAKNSPVIILDEPTAALDPIAEYEIYRQFNTLVGDKTAFYISHRLSSCKFCDRIAVFSDGKIAEYGTHNELVKLKDGIYSKMFEAQAEYYR